MPKNSSPRILSLIAAGLIAATALTATVTLTQPALVHAEAVVPGAPVGSFSGLVEQVMPAVIGVQVKFANAGAGMRDMMPGMPHDNPMRRFFEEMPGAPQLPDQMPRHGMSQGSGFIISADGYAVTNNHVVSAAEEVTITLHDGTELSAKVVGTDAKTDLALIKIDAPKPLPYVSFADEEAKVGDWIVAIGNPFGLGGTVTTGIISAMHRDIGSGPYDDFMQIDASINKGNSGGPAFDLSGKVVGINTAIYSPSGGSVGIGFAIPASMAEEVIDSLKDSGSVERGWLGVRIQPVTADIAEGLGLETATGAIVSEVTADSPALKAGLQTGDTILSVDGKPVSTARDLSRLIAKVKPGSEVELSVVRDGKTQTIKAAIGAMPMDRQANAGSEDRPANKSGAPQLGLRLGPAEDGAGVTVVGVLPGSAAGDQGIKAGDVILEVAGVDVNSPEDVRNALKGGVKNSKVVLLVKSGDGQRFVAVTLNQG